MMELERWLRTREAMLASLCTAIVAVLLLIAVIVLQLFKYQSDDSTTALRELSRYQAEAANLSAAKSNLRDAQLRVRNAPGVLRGGSISLAQVELENAFRSLAANVGANIRSMEVLKTTRVDGFDVIAVQFDIVVPESRLRDLAYAVETRNPYLFIDDGTLSAPTWQATGTTTVDPLLNVRWTVKGYRWNGSP